MSKSERHRENSKHNHHHQPQHDTPTVTIVDDALGIVFSENETIQKEQDAVHDQLHETDAYQEFLADAQIMLASGIAEDEFHNALCGVVTKAVYLGKKIGQIEAAKEAVQVQ